MLKSLIWSVALIGETSLALAQGTTYEAPRAHHRHHHLTADGRCDGISYGNGERSCGTASGGPVGGSAGRN